MLLPKSENILDITKALREKNYTVQDMIKRAEDYYVSLGFPSMPREFWENSVFTKRNSSDGNCHAAAVDMWNDSDYRMIACLDVNEEDFYVIHHELGHVHYYMAYRNQTPIFRVIVAVFSMRD